MSLQNAKIPTAVHWFSELDNTGHVLKPALRSWLTETGLLTGRLRHRCASDFRLELLADSPAQTADTLRCVLLCCGDSPCVYAETFLPAATRAAHPWLCALGSEPLGEALRSRPDVSRDAFEYALLSPAQLPPDLQQVEANATSLWARRSVFHVGREQLTVTEIFLPGILDCGDGHARTVD